MHLSSGGPKNHNLSTHKETPISRDTMVKNTKIIRREDDFRRLQIYEALLIQQKNPEINNQITGSARTLKLSSNNNYSRTIHRNNNHQSNQNRARQNSNDNARDNNAPRHDVRPDQSNDHENSPQSDPNHSTPHNHPPHDIISENNPQTNPNRPLTRSMALRPNPRDIDPSNECPISLSQPSEGNNVAKPPIQIPASQPTPIVRTAPRRSARIRHRPS